LLACDLNEKEEKGLLRELSGDGGGDFLSHTADFSGRRGGLAQQRY